MKKFLLSAVATALTICGAAVTGCSGSGNSTSGASSSDEVAEAPLTPADTFSYTGYTTLSEILAGKTPKDTAGFGSVVASKAFATHCSAMQQSWETYRAGTVDKIRQWSKDNLGQQPDTVFYPFSGPDFNYLSSFFPDVRYSVLVAAEKPGRLPLADAKSQACADSLFSALRSSIATNLRASFFVTKDMISDLNNELQGTLPVVMMFMSLHDFDVLNVNPVSLNADGTIAYTEPDKVYAHTLDKKYDNGFEIQYRKPGEKNVRTLVYLKYDLSDKGFGNNGLNNLVADKFSGKTTFIKAASYLMHYNSFSKVRNAILDNSKMVLTGPSGIPYKAFDHQIWDVALYGDWNPPYCEFSSYPQDDLREAYAQQTIVPLPFRYDYAKGKGFYIGRKK